MRYLVNDIQGKDPRSLLTTAVMRKFIMGCHAPESQFIKAKDWNTVTIMKDVMIDVDYNEGSIFLTDAEVNLTKSNLDAGSEFQIGKDYYIYIVDPGKLDQNEIWKISLNSTFPAGATAENSRKIGGFHYGRVRKINMQTFAPQNASNADWGTGWEDQVSVGINPFSVWCLHHRSAGQQEGMAFIPALSSWVSIYMLSVGSATGQLVSRYNATPVSGSEGYTSFDAMEATRSSGMRPLFFAEFVVAAEGSPAAQDNNTYAWSASGNTGRNKTGQIDRAVSIYGLCDCCGTLWEGGADTLFRNDWQEPIQTPSNPKKKGFDVYKFYPFNFGVFGGGYYENVNQSSRALFADVNPWIPNAEIGFRGIAGHISK